MVCEPPNVFRQDAQHLVDDETGAPGREESSRERPISIVPRLYLQCLLSVSPSYLGPPLELSFSSKYRLRLLFCLLCMSCIVCISSVSPFPTPSPTLHPVCRKPTNRKVNVAASKLISLNPKTNEQWPRVVFMHIVVRNAILLHAWHTVSN